MHGVVTLKSFLTAAKAAGMSDAEVMAVENFVGKNPEAGDIIEGAGGARKLRVAARGRGKSGGYRVITFFGGGDIPVFLITVFAKNERVSLTDAEKNQMRRELKGLADDYRTEVLKK